MGFLAYDNRVTSDGTWTDNGASFAADPPIENLGTIQTPSPHAEFDGDTASFQFAAGSAFTVRLLALIGHTLPDGATVTWKDESDVTIGSQTIARFKNRPQNSYVLLSAEDSISTIKCAISGAGSGTHRIASVFAGPAITFGQAAGFGYRNQSQGSITRISGTDWPFVDVRRRGIPIQWTGQQGEIIGVNRDGTEYAGDDAETILQTVGQYGQVIVAPLSKTQAEIDATAIYGLMDSAGEPEHVDGGIMRVQFTVVESR